jgi:hypothetical protein
MWQGAGGKFAIQKRKQMLFCQRIQCLISEANIKTTILISFVKRHTLNDLEREKTVYSSAEEDFSEKYLICFLKIWFVDVL